MIAIIILSLICLSSASIIGSLVQQDSVAHLDRSYSTPSNPCLNIINFKKTVYINSVIDANVLSFDGRYYGEWMCDRYISLNPLGKVTVNNGTDIVIEALMMGGRLSGGCQYYSSSVHIIFSKDPVISYGGSENTLGGIYIFLTTNSDEDLCVYRVYSSASTVVLSSWTILVVLLLL